MTSRRLLLCRCRQLFKRLLLTYKNPRGNISAGWRAGLTEERNANRRTLHPRFLRQDRPGMADGVRGPLWSRRRDSVRLFLSDPEIRQQYRIARTAAPLVLGDL